VQTVDLTFTHQCEEVESLLLETPLVEKIVDTDRLMGQLLPGSTCIHEDELFISQDDHSMCLDTFVWDPGTIVSSMVSAQEDTTAHTGYNMIQRELAVDEDIQSHIGGPSGTIDNRHFETSTSAESVVWNSSDDIGIERYEVAPQHDYDQESPYLTGQLRSSEDMIMTSTRGIDDMHTLVADYCRRASVAHVSADEGFSMDDLHALKGRVSMMRIEYHHFLIDMDYLLRISEMYHEALREKELEVDIITQELERT
jgi:hypothetical protein